MPKGPRAMHSHNTTKQAVPKPARKLGYTGKIKPLHKKFGYNPNQTLALMKLNIFGIR